MTDLTVTSDRPEERGQRANAAPSPALSDEALVLRIRSGDNSAAEELIARYQQKAYAIACHMGSGDREEARDLTQDAFVKMLKNINKFKGDSSFYTWFYRILVNTCLDARRRKRRWSKLMVPWRSGGRDEWDSQKIVEDLPDMRENINPLEVVSGRELDREVRKALDALSDKQRTVFQLRVFHEMTIPEIARIMNSAEGTVKTHLFRATQFLRKTLRGWGEYEGENP